MDEIKDFMKHMWNETFNDTKRIDVYTWNTIHNCLYTDLDYMFMPHNHSIQTQWRFS